MAITNEERVGRFRVYNIASGELISLQEMVDILKELYPSWKGEAGPGLDYRHMGVGYYFKMATYKAQAEIGFRPKFNFRSAAIDYAQTLARLKAGNASRSANADLHATLGQLCFDPLHK